MKTHGRRISVSHGRNIGVINLLHGHHLIIIGVMVVVIVTTFFGGNLKFQKGGYYEGTFGAFLMTLQILCFNLSHIVPKGKYLQDIIKKQQKFNALISRPFTNFKDYMTIFLHC